MASFFHVLIALAIATPILMAQTPSKPGNPKHPVEKTRGRFLRVSANSSSMNPWRSPPATESQAGYHNHAAADQNSADNLLLLLGAAGCNYFMGVPCGDDVMLNYQSTSYHDALAVRRIFKLRPAPEFLAWLEEMGIYRDVRTCPA